MYKDKYSKLDNEIDIILKKDKEFITFYNYVKNIYVRCKKEGHSHGRVLWEDFPYDFYEDVNNWIDKNNLSEVKEYIDSLKKEYPHIKDSATDFWAHWLRYKNVREKSNQVSNNISWQISIEDDDTQLIWIQDCKAWFINWNDNGIASWDFKNSVEFTDFCFSKFNLNKKEEQYLFKFLVFDWNNLKNSISLLKKEDKEFYDFLKKYNFSIKLSPNM